MKTVGYLKVKLDSCLDNEPGGLEIERIYLSKEAAGQGLGKQLIERAFGIARQLDKQYVWLKAMDSSANSLHFYRKRGFDVIGETYLSFPQMRPEYRRMWKLKKQLN
jgi:ribosomal protein S18 acetylase RimI-like enzyme